jgi:hypothetical protein
VLCTDGVYQSIDKNGWSEFIFDEPQTACDRIVNSISEKNLNQQDNATVAMLCYGFKGQAKTYPTDNHAHQPTAGAGHATEPVETRNKRKAGWRLWVIIAISLPLLLWVLWWVWLDWQNGKVVEDMTAIEIKLQLLPKPAEPSATPPKSSPKK